MITDKQISPKELTYEMSYRETREHYMASESSRFFYTCIGLTKKCGIKILLMTVIMHH